jgi:phage-related tail protein
MRNALLSSAQAADTLTGSIKLGNQAFQENNAHTAEAEKRWGTSAGQLEILKNNVVELALNLGNALLPSLNEAVASLRPFIDATIEWIKAHPELTAGIMKAVAALGAMLVVLGPVLIAVGAFIGVLASVVSAIAAVAAAPVSAIFAAIGAAIVAAIGMIIAAVGAMVYYWDEAVANLKAVWGWMSDTFWSIFGPILDAINAMTGWGIGGGGGVNGPQVPGMATGGTVQQSGWAVVGERGPELVQMPRGATVYDSQQSAPILQGGATTNSQNINVQFNRDSVRSDDDIRQIERILTRIIGTGMTANGTRVFA